MSKSEGITQRIRLLLDAAAKAAFEKDAQTALKQGTDPGAAKRNLATLEGGLTSLKRTVMGVAASLGVVLGVGAFFRKVATETINAQREMAVLETVIKNTGGAAGKTTQDILAMADAMEEASTFSSGEIVQGMTRLLGYTNITGDAFDRAAQLALDFAAAYGISVVDAAEKVGMALGDPERGMASLSKQGFRLSDQLKETVKDLVATGRTAEAQDLILKELASGGVDGVARAAKDTLGGALKGLEHAWSKALTASESSTTGIVGAINSVAKALPGMRAAADSALNFMIDKMMAVEAFWLRGLAGLQRIVGQMELLSIKIPGSGDLERGQGADRIRAGDASAQRAAQLEQDREDRRNGTGKYAPKAPGERPTRGAGTDGGPTPEEIAARKARTEEILKQRAAADELTKTMERQLDAAERLRIAEGQGEDYLRAVQIELAREAALRQLGANVTDKQREAVVRLAEQQELSRQAAVDDAETRAYLAEQEERRLQRIVEASREIQRAEEEAARVQEQAAEEARRRIEQRTQQAQYDPAGLLADSFADAFDEILSGADTVGTVLSRLGTDANLLNATMRVLGKGGAKSVLAELKAMAKGKAIEQTALALAATGRGLTNPFTATTDFAASKTHLLSAAKWGLLGAGIGLGDGGGAGGGGMPTQTGRIGASSVDRMEPAGTVIHVRVDGIDPNNPVHQDYLGQTFRSYAERDSGAAQVFVNGKRQG